MKNIPHLHSIFVDFMQLSLLIESFLPNDSHEIFFGLRERLAIYSGNVKDDEIINETRS